MDASTTQNVTAQFVKHWINPELHRRMETGQLPGDFTLERCLIRLPNGHPPIVEFNEEVCLGETPIPAPGVVVETAAELQIHQVVGFADIGRPAWNGSPVAFIYIFWVDGFFRVVFDFTPNQDEDRRRELESLDPNFRLGRVIADGYDALLSSMTIGSAEAHEDKLREMGLWQAPALIPFPLSLITKLAGEGDFGGARQALLSHCTNDFVAGLSNRWFHQHEFLCRESLLRASLGAHYRGEYGLCIHGLVPHIEGIITDWLWTNHSDKGIPFRQESKTMKLRDILKDVAENIRSESRSKVLASTFRFLLGGPFLSAFTCWTDELQAPFPSRHSIGHGRYEEKVYCIENSVKMILMLDTIFCLLSSAFVDTRTGQYTS